LDTAQPPSLPLGLFGASTGAAAALAAAAARPGRVRAVVSRGGRPDLAGPALGQVRMPVLLIVGGRDTQVAEWNQMASRRLPAPGPGDRGWAAVPRRACRRCSAGLTSGTDAGGERGETASRPAVSGRAGQARPPA